MKPLESLRILIIEDDQRMVELLRTGLWEKGHSVVTANSAEDGQQLLDENKFDAIVLDIGLPGRSGYSIAQYLRHQKDRPAIIMLTALNQEDHVVTGLDAGADDYLTKPFSFRELSARLLSATRRMQRAAGNDHSFGPYHLDISKHRLLHNNHEIHLTRSEYLLLRALVLQRGETVSRRQLMQAVWGTTHVSHGALDTLVNTLRDKFGIVSQEFITTVRGIGYRLLDDGELVKDKILMHGGNPK